jgi:hypothetical protein
VWSRDEMCEANKLYSQRTSRRNPDANVEVAARQYAHSHTPCYDHPMTAERSGDEPALGGQSDDLSPMISSMGTKIIADARGAYLAGNLRALVDSMSHEQQLTFRHSIVREAALVVRELIERWSGESKPIPESVQQDLDIALRWVAAPGAGSLEAVAVRAQDIRPGRLYLTNPETIVQRLLVTIVQHEAIAAQEVTRVFYTGRTIEDYSSVDRRRGNARNEVQRVLLNRWFLDNAWAIRQGKGPLPAPLMDADRLDALSRDSDNMRRTGNLYALVDLLDYSQVEQFRQIVISTSIACIKRTIPRYFSTFDADQAVLDTLQQWLESDVEFSSDDLYRHFRELPGRARRDPFAKAIEKVARCFIVGWPVETIASFCTEAIYLLHQGASDLPAEYNIVIETGARFKQWQVDVAWAILHDNPIPPLNTAD